MKKKLLIALGILAVLAIGSTAYFLSSPDRQVTETFSTFGFKNDPTERPPVGSEEEGGYGVSDDLSEIEEPEEGGWFTRWRNSRESTADEPEESGGGGSDAGSENGETTSGTLAQNGNTGTETTATGNTGSDTGTTNAGTTATAPAPSPTYTLSVVSPTAGSVLSNKSGSPIASIFWTYGDLTAKITVELHNETGLVRTLATKMSNSGRLTWDYSATLQDGNYKLVIRAYSSSGTLVTSAETGYFEVSRVKEASAPTEPKDASTPEEIFPVAKRWDDFIKTQTMKTTVDLAGAQVGSAPFDSWRHYPGGGIAAADGILLDMSPSFKLPTGWAVDLVISRTEGSLTPLSPRCSFLELSLGDRHPRSIKVTTKKFEELTEAQQRMNPCILEPDTRYYLNFRFVDQDGNVTCSVDRCGLYLFVHYSGLHVHWGGWPGYVLPVLEPGPEISYEPQNAAEQAACDEARDYYLSEAYSEWYYSLVPSTRALATAPGDSATAQRECETAVSNLRIFGGSDPWN